MLYYSYEVMRNIFAPYHMFLNMMQKHLKNPKNPWINSYANRIMSASCDLFEAMTRRYEKPEWRLHETKITADITVDVNIKTVLKKPFCNLLKFERDDVNNILATRQDPKVLIVAPMSGHHATLLRNTVKEMLSEHEVYITDWIDACKVSSNDGNFSFNSFIEYIIEFTKFIGANSHIIAVCQPGPPVLAATAIMSAHQGNLQPASLTLMGSPIDPTKSPTVPNKLACEKPLQWFEDNMITHVPINHAGHMRRVYPGFLQLASFISMNFDKHYMSHVDFFENLVKGCEDSVEKHKLFYDEYLSVMDIDAIFYLETIDKIFQKNLLAKGDLYFHNEKVDLATIKKTALLTIEGMNDDISGVGQTSAACELCYNLPRSKKKAYIHPKVGHYGIFNGRYWRNDIQPLISNFIREQTITSSNQKD